MTPIHNSAAASNAAARPARISMNPDVFTAGGLIDDVDVEITDALTTMYDYNGTAAPTPVLAVEFTELVNKATHVQYFGAGKPEDWQPEDSGEGFIPLSGKTSINNSTNLGKFLASLTKAGFPGEMFNDGNLKVLIGTKVHVVQEVVERKGLVRTGKNADRPSTVLVVTKLIEMPGGGGGSTSAKSAAPKSAAAVGGKSNGAAKSAPASAPAQATDASSDLASEVTSLIQTAVMEAEGGTLAKKDVTKIVFNGLKAAGHPQTEINQGVIMSGKQDFLAGLAEVGVVYDGATLALAQ